MDRSPYAPMTLSSEGPNPLRPYYRPPSIGATNLATDPSSNTTPPSTRPAPSSFGSSARNIISDLDYNELLSEGGTTTGVSIKGLVDQLCWKYSSVFMAQPFEVARTVLQVLDASSVLSAEEVRRREKARRRQQGFAEEGRGRYEEAGEDGEGDDNEDDDDEEPAYFTSSAPHSSGMIRQPKPHRYQSSTSASPSPSRHRPRQHDPGPSYRLELRRPDSLLEVLSQLWQREGSWGVWKGTNVTFLYSVLLKTIETWTRSLFSAVLNLPDPGLLSGTGGSVGGLDIIDSPSPLASLGTAVVAAGVAGLVLAPLDIVRTRLIITPTTATPRSILPCLRDLRTYTCPNPLLAPTLLHSVLPTLFSAATPLLLRAQMRIDPIITPATYSACTFLSSTIELFLRLPAETVLRRAQAGLVLDQQKSRSRARGHAVSRRRTRDRAARSRHRRRSEEDPEGSDNVAHEELEAESEVRTVVQVGAYTGVVGTMWRIAREEGESQAPAAGRRLGARPHRGQGVVGLWRGWRVGWWGLVGVWGTTAMGGVGSKGGEF